MSKTTKRAAIAILATGSLLFSVGTPAMAYPVDAQTKIELSKTSAIRSGSTIKVKAYNVVRGCEVTFSVDGRLNTEEDFDISSAFAGNNYQTAYTAISVPETPGIYKIKADYDTDCQPTGNHTQKTEARFQVGKITMLTAPTFTSTQTLISKKPTLNFNGTLKSSNTLDAVPTALAGQKVTVVVTVVATTGARKSFPAQTLTTDVNGNYTGKQALGTKDLKGSYTVSVSYTGDKVYSTATPVTSGSISIAKVKAKIAAAKAAAFAADFRKAAIAKQTR